MTFFFKKKRISILIYNWVEFTLPSVDSTFISYDNGIKGVFCPGDMAFELVLQGSFAQNTFRGISNNI